MIVYKTEVESDMSVIPMYFATQSEAVRSAREEWKETWGPHGTNWDVDNVLKVIKGDVRSDKRAQVGMMNGDFTVTDIATVKQWDFDHKRGHYPEGDTDARS